MFSKSPCGLADSEIRTTIAPDFKSVAATSGRRRVYQNKLLFLQNPIECTNSCRAQYNTNGK